MNVRMWMQCSLIFGLILSTGYQLHGMQSKPQCRATERGFQIFNSLTGEWGPEIPGAWEIFNRDLSAVIVDIAYYDAGHKHKFVVVKVATGKLLNEPLLSHLSWNTRQYFSKSGKIACLTDGDRQRSVIVNVETEQGFTIPGTWFDFSSDENFVVVHQEMDGECYQVIFDTSTGQQIVSIPGYKAAVSPYASTMLVGRWDNISCSDPVLVDMATGRQIGERLSGNDHQISPPIFSPDGQFVALQQYGGGFFWSDNPRVAVYSVITGALVRTVSGHFAYFDTDMVKTSCPDHLWRISDGARID